MSTFNYSLRNVALEKKENFNEKLFQGSKLRNSVRKKLMNIALLLCDKSKLKDLNIDIKDIVITGSNVNYNYDKNSDLDLHIIVDIDKFNKRTQEILKNYFSTKKTVLNTDYKFDVNGINVEFYIQDKNEPHHASGIYSIIDNEFVKKPSKKKPKINKDKIKELINIFKEKIENINCENTDSIMEELKEMRQKGLEKTEFEFSEENLTFKILRNNGYIKKVKDFQKSCEIKKVELP